MGYITKALAQIGMGEPPGSSMQVFDLAFGNCDPKEGKLLLLIKVRSPYVSPVPGITNHLCSLGYHLICGPEMRHRDLARS